jgi:hypothetical protein
MVLSNRLSLRENNFLFIIYLSLLQLRKIYDTLCALLLNYLSHPVLSRWHVLSSLITCHVILFCVSDRHVTLSVSNYNTFSELNSNS